MDLPNPKDLKALLKVCRDAGVESVEFGAIKVKFGELPNTSPQAELIAMDSMPSNEEMAYWSSQPDPLLERQA